MVIDTHAHVFFLEKFIDYDDKPLFQYMEEQEVDICSCIAAANKENIGVIENVQKYKDKLFGIGYVNVQDMEHSLKMLRENVDKGIFRGIKMHPYVEDYIVDDPALNPLYETCLELDIPLLFHNGIVTFSSWPSDEPGKTKLTKYECIGFPHQFAKVLERYPELKIIFAHFGGNFYRELLCLTERFENAYLDTAWLRHYAQREFPSTDIHRWIEHAVSIVGSKKVLFAGEGTLPSDILQCNLTEDEKADILYKNAKELYRLDCQE